MLLNLKLNVSLVYYFTINVLFLLVSFVFICVIFQTLEKKEEEVTSDEEEGEKKKQEEEQQDGEEQYDEEEFEEVSNGSQC